MPNKFIKLNDKEPVQITLQNGETIWLRSPCKSVVDVQVPEGVVVTQYDFSQSGDQRQKQLIPKLEDLAATGREAAESPSGGSSPVRLRTAIDPAKVSQGSAA